MNAAGTPVGADRRGSIDQALVVARMSALDLLRRPGTWSVTLLTGVLFAVLFAGLGLITNRSQERAEQMSFLIAVDGDLVGGAEFLEQLSSEKLIIKQFPDAAEAVTTARASAGLTIPAGIDANLANGQVSDINFFYRATHNTSQEALNTLLLRIQGLEDAAIDARSGSPDALASPPRPVEMEIREVKQDPRVNRNQFASSLAAMACVLCLGTISSVTGVFGRSQEQRTLEPMLLLPVRRGMLTAGLALGAFPVAVLQLIAAQTILLAATALPVEGLQQPAAEVGRMLVLGVGAAVLLGGLATAAGCIAGTIGIGTDDAVSLGDFLSLPFVAMGVVLFLNPDLAATLPLAAVPILGPAIALRDGVRGVASLTYVALTLATSAVWIVCALRFAGNRVGREQRLLRATR